MPLVLQKRPKRIANGDTVQFKYVDPKFSTDEYDTVFVIGSSDPSVTTFAADSDNIFTVSFTGVTPGVVGCYFQQLLKTDPTAKFTVPAGNIIIAQDPTVAPILTRAQTDLQNALATRSALLLKKVQTGTVNGESYTLKSLAELNRAINQLVMEVNRDLGLQGRKPLSGGAKKIQTYFGPR